MNREDFVYLYTDCLPKQHRKLFQQHTESLIKQETETLTNKIAELEEKIIDLNSDIREMNGG